MSMTRKIKRLTPNSMALRKRTNRNTRSSSAKRMGSSIQRTVGTCRAWWRICGLLRLWAIQGDPCDSFTGQLDLLGEDLQVL